MSFGENIAHQYVPFLLPLLHSVLQGLLEPLIAEFRQRFDNEVSCLLHDYIERQSFKANLIVRNLLHLHVIGLWAEATAPTLIPETDTWKACKLHTGQLEVSFHTIYIEHLSGISDDNTNLIETDLGWDVSAGHHHTSSFIGLFSFQTNKSKSMIWG